MPEMLVDTAWTKSAATDCEPYTVFKVTHTLHTLHITVGATGVML